MLSSFVITDGGSGVMFVETGGGRQRRGDGDGEKAVTECPVRDPIDAYRDSRGRFYKLKQVASDAYPAAHCGRDRTQYESCVVNML
jgi:hypothetical protein